MSHFERLLNAIRNGVHACRSTVVWFGNLSFVRQCRDGIETIVIAARIGNVTIIDLAPPFAPILAVVIHHEVMLALVSATMSLAIKLGERAVLSKG